MKIYIIAFTNRGMETAERVSSALVEHETEIMRGEGLDGICAKAFDMAIPLVFVGAAGIAVRAVAPHVRDKLTDPPVIVIDELGRYVIPVLSGHAGGGNALAAGIAGAIDAEPVITTATDINQAFPVDVFARENGLAIHNRDGIAKVSVAALEGRPVTISIKDYPPSEPVDVMITDEPWKSAGDGRMLRDAASIVLCPRTYAVGIGCRRGKSFRELRDHAETRLAENGISLSEVGCIATIDIKKDEEGLRELAQAWRVPLITFDAEMLARVPGSFTSSETVLARTGVDNVCERAAVLAAGSGSELVVRKQAGGGITFAAARKRR